MTVAREHTVHHVAMFNDDTGNGSTSCGIRVMPSDITSTGTVDCQVCKNHMDGTWLRKMAKLEDGSNVCAGL
jgi:hypothetical protein